MDTLIQLDKKDYDYRRHHDVKSEKSIHDDQIRNNVEYIKNKVNSHLKEISDYSYEDTFHYLIKDSIYCCSEILASLKTYGIGYTISYSYKAHAHRNMGNWCRFFRIYKKFLLPDENKEKLEKALYKELKELVGPNGDAFLEDDYHFDLALQNFYYAIQMHNEGYVYKDKLNEMYYLEDDFNDTLNHFFAALERYKLNLGVIREEIDKIKNSELDPPGKLSGTVLYDYDNYI